jgi:hypothetical protein
MPPCQEVVEKGIAGKDIVLPLLRMLVAPFAHENFHRLAPSRGSTRVALATWQLALVNPEGAVKARRPPVAGNLPAASQDAQACRSCAPAWLTDYESLIPNKESRTNATMDRDDVGARTAVVAVGLVVERN